MSDQWDFFPSTRDGQQAFIFFDKGISEHLASLQQRFVVRFVVHFKNPTENGMPTDDESKVLRRLEDELTARVQKLGGVYVGRVTTAGTRTFVFYWDFGERASQEIAQRLSASYRYDTSVSIAPDPEKKVYWQELFPSESELRSIKDIRVIEALESHGDDLSTERKIEHWVYFPMAEQRDAFMDWAESAGYSPSVIESDYTKEFGVRLSHVARPSFDSINLHTLELLEEAKAHGGDYDGWETYVVRDEDSRNEVTN